MRIYSVNKAAVAAAKSTTSIFCNSLDKAGFHVKSCKIDLDCTAQTKFYSCRPLSKAQRLDLDFISVFKNPLMSSISYV